MWKNIRQRTNGKSKSPRNRAYVERGIKVCAEWDDFTAFRDFALEQYKNRIYTKKRKAA